MKTGYEIKGQDLADLVEYSRDPATDPVAPLASYGFKNTGKDFPVSSIPSQGSFPGTGVNINPYFSSDLGSIPLLMPKGGRPRLDHKKISMYESFEGSSQPQYFYVSRTETTLYFFQSYNPTTGFTLRATKKLGSSYYREFIITPQYKVRRYTKLTEESGIPKYLYVELVGSGGGGASGLFMDSFLGGVGGSGGGIAYTIIPIGAYRSNYSVRDTSTDFYFEVFPGGAGGPLARDSVQGLSGSDGKNTTAYSPKGSVFAYGAKGRGGSRNSTTATSPYPQSSPSYNTLFQIAGGAGAVQNTKAPDISLPAASINGENIKLFFSASFGGHVSTSSSYSWNGGGGGASRDMGGHAGWGNSSGGSVSPGAGKFGGGGGGGVGAFFTIAAEYATAGAAGGNGLVSFFY